MHSFCGSSYQNDPYGLNKPNCTISLNCDARLSFGATWAPISPSAGDLSFGPNREHLASNGAERHYRLHIAFLITKNNTFGAHVTLRAKLKLQRNRSGCCRDVRAGDVSQFNFQGLRQFRSKRPVLCRCSRLAHSLHSKLVSLRGSGAQQDKGAVTVNDKAVKQRFSPSLDRVSTYSAGWSCSNFNFNSFNLCQKTPEMLPTSLLAALCVLLAGASAAPLEGSEVEKRALDFGADAILLKLPATTTKR